MICWIDRVLKAMIQDKSQ